jgi:hypothetical protein
MSATMARQGDQVTLEQSDLHLVMNMPEMANGALSHLAIKKSQYVLKKPCSVVQEKRMWGLECPSNRKRKDEIEKHLAMVCEDQTDGCLH